MAVKVKQTDQPVDTEVLADAIVAISVGVKKLLQTPLKERTLYMLIADAAPSFGKRQTVGIREVKAVLQGIVDLEKTHLKKAK